MYYLSPLNYSSNTRKWFSNFTRDDALSCHASDLLAFSFSREDTTYSCVV